MHRRLRDAADIHYGRSPKAVLHEDGIVPVLGTGGLYGQATQSLFTGPAVVVARKGTLGNPQYVEGPFWPVDTTYAVLPRPGIDARWLYYSLDLFDLTKLNEATGVPSISRDWLYRVELGTADSFEQQRIAEILTAVDEAIEQTEALIAKTQQIKAGLMHDLFTRGVTPNGQLRPPRREAPQLYKTSPLGWIPKEWDVQPCSALTEMITVGIVVRPTQYYVAEGVPAFRSANIREDGIDPTDLVFISAQSNAQLSKSQVRAGDVLSVRTGYPGTSAVVPPEYAGVNCIDILISRPSDCLRSNYLAAWINSPFGKEQVLRKQGGLAQQHFNVGELRDLTVALPGLPEQDAMFTRLAAVDEELVKEGDVMRKYRLMKSGLMHDLLTGRVRVPEKGAS
jgi:type I restriction enzyme S subunit